MLKIIAVNYSILNTWLLGIFSSHYDYYCFCTLTLDLDGCNFDYQLHAHLNILICHILVVLFEQSLG